MITSYPSSVPIQGQDLTLIYRPELAKVLKELDIPHPGEAAIWLNQIAFWLKTKAGHLTRDGRKWIYNSMNDWAEQITSLSSWQLHRLINALADIGLVEKSNYARLKRELVDEPPVAWHEYNTTTWLTLNLDKLEELTGWNPFSKEGDRKAPAVEGNGKELASDRDFAATNSSFAESDRPNLSEQKRSISEKSKVLPKQPEPSQNSQSQSGADGAEKGAFAQKESHADGDAVKAEPENPEQEQIWQAVKASIGLNPKLKAFVLDYSLKDIQAALSLYRERSARKAIAHPAAWLKQCLLQGWHQGRISPESSQQRDHEKITPEQRNWYEWAAREGLIRDDPMNTLPEIMGELEVRAIAGELRSPQFGFTLMPIGKMMQLYPKP
jgi:hypothetical protein